MSELFSGVGVFILIALTIINLVIYHTVFSVTYFGNLGRHFIREVITAWIVAVLEMALVGSILMKIFGAVAAVFVVIEKILFWILMVMGTVYFYINFKKGLHCDEEKIVSQNKIIRILQRIWNAFFNYRESLTTKQQILYGLSVMVVLFEVCALGGVIGRAIKGSQTTQVADYNETTQYESTDVDSKINDDIDTEKSEEQYTDIVYVSYRMDLNNEDSGWCEANVREEDGNIFLDIAGYIYGDQDVADLSGQLERQENGTYTVSNLYIYDGDVYFGEDVPENVSVDVVFADACMTVQIVNVDGATVSQLSGIYDLSSNDSASREEIQRVEEYVYQDDTVDLDIGLEYTGENEGNLIWNETHFDENYEVTTVNKQKLLFSLIDESGIYGVTYPDTGEMDSLVFTIITKNDGGETYKCMNIINDNKNVNLELPEKDYVYSHAS